MNWFGIDRTGRIPGLLIETGVFGQNRLAVHVYNPCLTGPVESDVVADTIVELGPGANDDRVPKRWEIGEKVIVLGHDP